MPRDSRRINTIDDGDSPPSTAIASSRMISSKGPSFPVEGHGPIEVGDSNQCGAKRPRLCGVVSVHGVPPGLRVQRNERSFWLPRVSGTVSPWLRRCTSAVRCHEIAKTTLIGPASLREGCIEDALDRCFEGGVELIFALMDRQSLGERTREAGDHAVVGGRRASASCGCTRRTAPRTLKTFGW